MNTRYASLLLIAGFSNALFATEIQTPIVEHCLTNEDAESRYASYSPDGEKILFESDRSGSWNLYLMNADGSNVEPIIETEGDQRRPSWNPNGNVIVFESIQNTKSDLVTFNFETRAQTRLDAFDHSIGKPMFARYSPDGSEISVSVQKNEQQANIVILSSDGTVKDFVTELDTRNYYSQWSPNGKSLVFHSRMFSNNEDDEIVVWKRGTKELTRLTNWPTHNFCPAWSRDGARIAFAQSMPNSRSEIFIMQANGSGKLRITNNDLGETLPSWAPDGKSLLLTAFRKGHYQICSVKLSG
jgi:Tol biopolymer transport system component